MEKIKFWEDAPGSQSSGRLIYIVSSFWDIFLTTILILRGVEPLIVMAFFSGMQAVISGAKLYQNKQENNADKNNLDNNTSSSTI